MICSCTNNKTGNRKQNAALKVIGAALSSNILRIHKEESLREFFDRRHIKSSKGSSEEEKIQEETELANFPE